MRILLALVMCLGMSLSTKADPGDGWPWSAALEFPWKNIQGTWMGQIDGEPTYISFRTVQSKNGTNILDIILYKGCSCEIVAKGRGFEEGKTVRAMILLESGAMKILTVGVFSEAVMKYGREGGSVGQRARKDKTFTVMSLSDMREEQDQNYQLIKVHSSSNGICSERRH